MSFYQGVSPGYFEMMRVPIIEGRALDARDGSGAPGAVVINQTMARAFYGNESPIGRRIRRGGNDRWRTIVGIAADVKNAGVDKTDRNGSVLPICSRPTECAACIYW